MALRKQLEKTLLQVSGKGLRKIEIFWFYTGVFVADSATKATTARDALHSQSQQHGFCVSSWFGNSCGLSDCQQEGQCCGSTIPLCPVQD